LVVRFALSAPAPLSFLFIALYFSQAQRSSQRLFKTPRYKANLQRLKVDWLFLVNRLFLPFSFPFPLFGFFSLSLSGSGFFPLEELLLEFVYMG